MKSGRKSYLIVMGVGFLAVLALWFVFGGRSPFNDVDAELEQNVVVDPEPVNAGTMPLWPWTDKIIVHARATGELPERVTAQDRQVFVEQRGDQGVICVPDENQCALVDISSGEIHYTRGSGARERLWREYGPDSASS